MVEPTTIASLVATVTAPYVAYKARQTAERINETKIQIRANELRSAANRRVLDPDENLPPEPDPADDRIAVLSQNPTEQENSS